MSDKIINREELPKEYEEMMKSESHHSHEIIEDVMGKLRWKEDPFIVKLVDSCNLNDIVLGFHKEGTGKNSEVYREFYRRMGYSLDGYWEVFYWELNNPDYKEYALNP